MSTAYRGGFAEAYDLLNVGVDYAEIADRAVGAFSSRGISSGLLLDLACGTGALSAELSRRGFEVIGTDISPDMLCLAQDRNSGLSRPVMYLCQSMEALDLYGTVEAAVCTMDSLNHLDGPEALGRVLDRLRLFIRPGGVLFFDMNTPYKHRQVLGGSAFVREAPGAFCVWQCSPAGDNASVDISLSCFLLRGGTDYSLTRSEFREFAPGQDELLGLLRSRGFVPFLTSGGYSFDGPGERQIFAAVRE